MVPPDLPPIEITEAFVVKELPGVERNGRPCVQTLIPVMIKNLPGRPAGERILVPAGFVTDFASIPRACWSLIGSPLGRYARAAIIHDWLYETNGDWGRFTREDADRVFLAAMQELGVSWAKRSVMFRAVRLGGGSGWRTDPGSPVRKIEFSPAC